MDLSRKKSFRLLFKDNYGPTKLNFRMFDTEDAPVGSTALSGPRGVTSFDTITLRAGANGVSFGRYVTAAGKVCFVAMSRRTFGADDPRTLGEFRTGKGAPNAPPKVGPVVISEIMYNPAGSGEEFIELHNISDDDVNLYDPSHPANTWRLDRGVKYTFPTGALIRAKGYCLVVGIARRVFRRWYRVPRDVPVFGPWAGRLRNGGGDRRVRHA